MTRMFLITALVGITTTAAAQQRYDIQQYDGQNESSLEDARPAFNDIENAQLYSWSSHPALVDWMSLRRKAHSIVKATFSNDATSGLYIHYRGKQTVAGELLAGGQMKIKNIGTLYGHASYAMTGRKGMHENFTVRPDDYRPYLVSDSTSNGKTSYETYRLAGGFSFAGHHGWHFGVSGLYEGIALAMKDQPRHSAYSYWFRLGFDVAKTTPRWVAALKVWSEINKQSITANSSLTPYRYLQFYGFGQWNRRETTSGYSYARQMRILGAGGNVLFSLLPDEEGGWQATLDAGYNYRWMETEETSYKKLFAAKTHYLTHNLAVSKGIGRNVRFHLLVSGLAASRNGQENVYENRRVNEEQNLYDYILVGKNELYKNTWYEENMRLKAVWQATKEHAFSLSGGACIDGFKEEYSMPDLLSENHSATLSGAVGWQMNLKCDHVDWEASFATRSTSNNKYKGLSQTTLTESTQSIIPWQIRGENRQTFTTSLVYTHDMKKASVGAKAGASYMKRTKLPDLPLANRHETQVSVSVFCTF